VVYGLVGWSESVDIRGARYWRLPFLEQKEHGEFRTWIYGFTVCIPLVAVCIGEVLCRIFIWQWEDPEVDMQHLKLTHDDTLFVITSAGDSGYLEVC
jgi:betaine lipid synthase